MGSFNDTPEKAGPAGSKVCIQDCSKILELLSLCNLNLKPCPQLLGKTHLIITASVLRFHGALQMQTELELSPAGHGAMAVAGLDHGS